MPSKRVRNILSSNHPMIKARLTKSNLLVKRSTSSSSIKRKIKITSLDEFDPMLYDQYNGQSLATLVRQVFPNMKQKFRSKDQVVALLTRAQLQKEGFGKHKQLSRALEELNTAMKNLHEVDQKKIDLLTAALKQTEERAQTCAASVDALKKAEADLREQAERENDPNVAASLEQQANEIAVVQEQAQEQHAQEAENAQAAAEVISDVIDAVQQAEATGSDPVEAAEAVVADSDIPIAPPMGPTVDESVVPDAPPFVAGNAERHSRRGGKRHVKHRTKASKTKKSRSKSRSRKNKHRSRSRR